MSLGQNSGLRAVAVLAVWSVVGVAGCGQKGTSQSVDQVLQASGKSRANVIPLAGRITIDSQTPEASKSLHRRMIVLLFDQAKLDAPANSVPKTFCDPKGEFAFSSYDQGDGVAPGKYVLTVVEFNFDKRSGYGGPDGLKNLYSDPVANSKIPELIIDHQPPGKKDYVIDLKLAGREAVTPGPQAVTLIRK
jgi:hypothetical protein